MNFVILIIFLILTSFLASTASIVGIATGIVHIQSLFLCAGCEENILFDEQFLSF